MKRKKVRHAIHLIDHSKPEYRKAAERETSTKGEEDVIRCKSCGHPIAMKSDDKYHHCFETVWNSLGLPVGSCAFFKAGYDIHDWCGCENPEPELKESE